MNKSWLFLALVGFLACNRNTHELPPPKDNTIVKSINAFLNSTSIVSIKFSQNKFDKEGKVSIEVKNLTGADLNQLRIIIEMCDSAASYYSCDNEFVCLVSNLDTGANFRQTLPFQNINLATVNITTGIISAEGKAHPLAGVYNGDYVQCESTTGPNTGMGLAGFVKGYVFADGNATFRMAFPNEQLFNITGTFIDTTALTSGKLLSKNSISGLFDQIGSLITLDTTYTNSSFHNTPIKFRVALATPQNIAGNISPTSDRFVFNLNKLP